MAEISTDQAPSVPGGGVWRVDRLLSLSGKDSACHSLVFTTGSKHVIEVSVRLFLLEWSALLLECVWLQNVTCWVALPEPSLHTCHGYLGVDISWTANHVDVAFLLDQSRNWRVLLLLLAKLPWEVYCPDRAESIVTSLEHLALRLLVDILVLLFRKG